MHPANYNASSSTEGQASQLSRAMGLQPRSAEEEQRLLLIQKETLEKINELSTQEKSFKADSTKICVQMNDLRRALKVLKEQPTQNERHQEGLQKGYKYSCISGKKRRVDKMEADYEVIEKVELVDKKDEAADKISKNIDAVLDPTNSPTTMMEGHEQAIQLANAMNHEISGLDLSPWLFDLSDIGAVPQVKIEATTAPEVFDTHVKTGNKTWEQLDRLEQKQWELHSQRIKDFQKDEEKAGLILLFSKEMFEEDPEAME